MKKVITMFALLALVTAVSCGGGSSAGPAPTPAPTPTPTSTDSKAAATASVDATNTAVAAAIENSVSPFASVSPLDVSSKTATPVAWTLNYDYSCSGGGTASVAGTLNLSCTGTEASATCTLPGTDILNITFSDCMVTQTIDSDTYDVTINGAATTTVAGTATILDGEPVSVSLTGSLSGTPTLSGDVIGTVNLSGIGWSATATSEEDPDVQCSGAATVTLTAPSSSEQVCGINAACDSCTE